jgi:ribosomal protein L7Ae-like RNA K-turn-binding protein
MGDNSTQNAIGRRNIKIVMIVGDATIKGMVTNVLHVPGITQKKKHCQ